nr:Uncharacterised protein [Klebsiella pneumoniae]
MPVSCQLSFCDNRVFERRKPSARIRTRSPGRSVTREWGVPIRIASPGLRVANSLKALSSCAALRCRSPVCQLSASRPLISVMMVRSSTLRTADSVPMGQKPSRHLALIAGR